MVDCGGFVVAAGVVGDRYGPVGAVVGAGRFDPESYRKSRARIVVPTVEYDGVQFDRIDRIRPSQVDPYPATFVGGGFACGFVNRVIGFRCDPFDPQRGLPGRSATCARAEKIGKLQESDAAKSRKVFFMSGGLER